MFSYRHAFHAGNHADVLKHVVLIQLLRHLAQKETPFWVVDTHAGAGVYALDSTWATTRSEFAGGIGRLWERKDAPAPVSEYLELVRSMNPDGRMRVYPGSPFIALRLMREQDRLRLFELHVNEGKALLNNITEDEREATRRTVVMQSDGFAGLKALLPPPPRRALILMDPSYEDKEDYARVGSTLRDALTRFPTGCYAIWYPQVHRREPFELARKLTRMPGVRWLHATLTVSAPPADGLGLFGSGMFVVNPPWTLEGAMRSALPYLTKVLGQDRDARFELQAVRG